MANKVYPLSITKIMKADMDLDTVDTRFVAVSSSYVYSATHAFLSSITNQVSAIVAGSSPVVADVTGGGNLDCADLTLTSVTGTAAAIVCCDYNGGADSARKLLAYFDTGVSGLPVTLSGGTIPLTINSGGILSITTA